MDKKQEQAAWLGHPIAHQDHSFELERKSALYEFHHGFPRQEAEKRALEEYQQEQHAKGAAHHLSGMKAAHASGHSEAAKQHHDMYVSHMQQLGMDAHGAVPPKILVHMKDPAEKVYDFKPHGADQFIAQPKGEESLSKGTVIPFPTPQQQPNPAAQGPAASVHPIDPPIQPASGLYDALQTRQAGRIEDAIRATGHPQIQPGQHDQLVNQYRGKSPTELKAAMSQMVGLALKAPLSDEQKRHIAAIHHVVTEQGRIPPR